MHFPMILIERITNCIINPRVCAQYKQRPCRLRNTLQRSDTGIPGERNMIIFTIPLFNCTRTRHVGSDYIYHTTSSKARKFFEFFFFFIYIGIDLSFFCNVNAPIASEIFYKNIYKKVKSCFLVVIQIAWKSHIRRMF